MKENDLIQQEIIIATGNELSIQPSSAIFREKLAAFIHQLINKDFEKLISLLYRLDVHEKKLKEVLQENISNDAGFLIADAIIERQQEKIASRKKFSSINRDIPEEEKW